jgi:hypothetical protein
LPRVAGHRDADSTDCPGDALYGELPSLRQGAVRLAGRPARSTLQLQAAETASAPTVLAGSVRLLDGTPVASAPIEIQVRKVTHKGETVAERTVAQAVTDSDGRWSLAVTRSPGAAGTTALRAVYAGDANLPAAVSDPMPLAGAGSFNVAPPPTPGQAPAPSAPGSPPPAA